MSKCTNSEVIEILRESDAVTVTGDLPVDVPLKQLGVQSLDKFNVFLLIEEKFGVTVPDEDFDKLDSIESIAAYINEA